MPDIQMLPDAISQICLILGDIDGAIEAQTQMLQIMKEYWTSEVNLLRVFCGRSSVCKT